MARNSSKPSRSTNSKHRISQTQVKKSNASGYAKRQERKAAKASSRSDDFYEYAPEKVRRSKVALDLDRDEELEAGLGGGDEGGENDLEDFRMKARLIGENGDDEQVDSDDDEEIDSDAAFDEDDDERFAGFFSTKKKNGAKKTKKKAAPSVHFAEVDLNEDEDVEVDGISEANEGDSDEESGADDEFIDVLDILDGRGEPLDNDEDNGSGGPPKPEAKPSYSRDSEEDEDEPQEDEDDDGEERISISLSDAEEEAAGALDELQTFISSLDTSSTKKRKAGDDDGEQNPDTSTGSKKRRTIKERTEAGLESEFRTKSAGLSLNDLLVPLGGAASSSLGKSVKALQSSSGDGSSSGKKRKPETLSAPLPQRTQERLEREAAYEKTKEEVDKWGATMKRITEAEHLSFPLQAQPQGRVSNLELAAKFKPSTALETTISSLLSSANLSTDASVMETEENILKANALSVEEVAERRRELRRMRELMFRAEAKAKRVKKIKSKVYRRLRRKEKEAADGEENGDDMDEDDEERRLKREMERARERATLKHKNTGKWAKKMTRRDGYGEDDDGEGVRGGRHEIEEMLSRGEKLRRKIQGQGSDEDDSESDEDEDEDDGAEGGVRAAFDELKALRGDGGEEDVPEDVGKKGKSIFEMKFMKDAMARKQVETDKMVDDFVREMGEGDEGDSDVGGNQIRGQEGAEESSGVVVSRTGGRIVFQPGAGATKRGPRTFSVASDNTSSSTLKSSAEVSPLTSFSPLATSSGQQLSRPLLSEPSEPSSSSTPAAVANPWLAPPPTSQTGTKISRKNNEVVVDKDSSSMTKSKHKLKKQNKKTEEGKARAKDDSVVEIETTEVLGAVASGVTSSSGNDGQNVSAKSKGKGKGKEKAKVSKAAAAADDDRDDSDVNSELEEQEKMLQAGKGKKSRAVKAFEQRELVARAFAGDNVVKDFEEAKRREIAMDAPKEVDTTLPGWGSWGGNGLRKAPSKPHLIKKVAGVDPTTRADYNKAHVIISEKRDKKASKYLVKDLPYPYTSKAQFERRMQQPLGPEWNTRVGFQRGTLPKVVKKMGTVIDPLEKLF